MRPPDAEGGSTARARGIAGARGVSIYASTRTGAKGTMAVTWKRFDGDLWRERAARARRRLQEAWADRGERKIVIGLGLVSLASCTTGAAAAAWTRACSGTCPSAEQVQEFAPRQASQVLDARGGLLGSFYRERRTLVSIRTLPRYVPMAFVAIEDARFFHHEGVDPVRVLGAIRDNVIGGFGSTGGSTITMQLAREKFPPQPPPQQKSGRRQLGEGGLGLGEEGPLSKGAHLRPCNNHHH